LSHVSCSHLNLKTKNRETKMSKLLLSTSMVVALMTASSFLHAETAPPFDNVTLDSQEGSMPANEGTVTTDQTAASTDQNTVDTDVKTLGTEESNFSPEAKKTFEDLQETAKKLDAAIADAKSQNSPSDQQKAYEEISGYVTDVAEDSSKLATQLPQGPDSTEATKTSTDVTTLEQAERTLDQGEVTLEKDATPNSLVQQELGTDAEKLSSKDDQEIAANMSTQLATLETSLSNAQDINQGLVDSGLSEKDSEIETATKAINNLKAVIADITATAKQKSNLKK